MKNLALILTMAALLLLLAACQGGGEDQKVEVSVQPTPEIIRGDYLFDHEVRALRPCGETEDVWVIDPTGVLAGNYRELFQDLGDGTRLKVIALGRSGPAPAEGFGAEYPSSVTIEEVIYAAREGYGCDFDLTGFTYRAYGNEPFWHVIVTPGQMKLTWPGPPDQVWTEVTREEAGDTVIFRGSGTDSPAVLTILPGPGYDDMSGSYFHQRARFQWGEHDMKGPALQGFPEDGP